MTPFSHGLGRGDAIVLREEPPARSKSEQTAIARNRTIFRHEPPGTRLLKARSPPEWKPLE